MRTKALLGLAVLAAGALTAAAQTSVYSLNVVGYYTVTVPAGKFQIIANQMVSTNYQVSNLLNVPAGTVLYKWAGASYQQNTFDADLGWDYPDMTLGPGEATFIKNTTAAPISLTFVGEVNQATNSTAFPAKAYKMASIFTPQAGDLAADFGFAPGDQDVVMTWKGASFQKATYDALLGWDNNPTVGVGEGAFFYLQAAQTWTRSFTVK